MIYDVLSMGRMIPEGTPCTMPRNIIISGGAAQRTGEPGRERRLSRTEFTTAQFDHFP